jgi:integrase
MADSTRAKVRNIFSVLFNHCDPVRVARNKAGIRSLSSGKVRNDRDPVVLEPKEIQAILAQLEPGARLMVMLAVAA